MLVTRIKYVTTIFSLQDVSDYLSEQMYFSSLSSDFIKASLSVFSAVSISVSESEYAFNLMFKTETDPVYLFPRL